MSRSTTTNRTVNRPLLAIGAVLTVAVLAVAVTLARGGIADAGDPAGAVRHVSVQELARASADGALVIDVREPWEYAEGHVEGSLLLPLAQVAEAIPTLPRDREVYVVCRSGNRSLVAAEALVAAGFTDVRNVDGGMIAWNAARLPVAR
jgi:rhodanese-related sulfurtransferase